MDQDSSNNGMPWQFEGNKLHELYKVLSAKERHNDAINLKPDYAISGSNKGITLRSLDRKIDEIESYGEEVKFIVDAVKNNDIGKNHYNNGKFVDSITYFDRAIKLKPDYAAYNNKGLALYKLNQTLLAIECYNEAIKLNPEFPDTYVSKGLALRKIGEIDDAIECYDQAIKLNPISIDAFFNKGFALRCLKRNLEALECYNEAIRLKPDSALAYLNKGIFLKDLGRDQEAIEWFHETTKIAPDCADAYIYKGNSFYNLGRNLEAIDCYNESIKIKPNHAFAYNNKGLALYNLGRNFEAMNCYNEAIKHNPEYAEAYNNNNKGNAFGSLGKYIEAINCYNNAIKNDYTEAYYNKGLALANLNRYFEAKNCYDEAIKSNPEWAQAYYNNGLALSNLERNLEAIEYYSKAIEIKPDYAIAYIYKSVALEDLGRNLEANECFNEALKLKPDIAAAHYYKSLALNNLGKKLEAMKCYNEFITLKSNNPLYLCSRAKLFNELGNLIEALQDFNKAHYLMQEMHENNISSILPMDFSRENIPFITEKINQDLIKLLKNVSKLQENAIEYNKEFEKLKNSIQCSTETQKEIEEQENWAKKKHKKIVEKAIDCLEPKNIESVMELQEKINQLEKEFVEFIEATNERIAYFWSRIEDNRIVINYQIKENENLKNYYEALFSKLYCALREAENICSDGNFVRDTQNSVFSTFSQALKLTPLIEDLLSNTFSNVTNTITKKQIKANAIKLTKVLGSTPDIRQNMIKTLAAATTLSNKKIIEDIENNSEIDNWINKGILAKCKDFFLINADRELSITKPKILGFIDALKMLDAIQKLYFPKKLTLEMIRSYLVLVPSSYEFTKDDDKGSSCITF